jgi:hypothetical protein
MPLSNVFHINIALNTVRQGAATLGIMVIAATGIDTEIPEGEVRAVTSTDDLEDLGFTNTDPVWLAFEASIGQDDVLNGSSPSSVYIGSRADPVAQVETLSIPASPGNGDYVATINGVSATFTASSSTQTQVRDGLLAAINGTSQAPFVTATSGSGTVIITSDQAGRPFSISISSPSSSMTVAHTTPNTGFYDDLDDFADYVRTNRLTPIYGVTETSRLDAALIEGARWCETNNNAFLPQSDDSGIPVAATTTDIASQLQDLERARTSLLYKSSDAHYGAEAVAGKLLSKTPGTYNPAWQVVAIPDDVITSTQHTAIKDKDANLMEEIGGDTVYFYGRTSGGTYLDLIVSRDDLELSIRNNLASLYKSEDIVPQDEPEITAANIAATIASKAYVIPGTGVVEHPTYDEIPEEDRSNRNTPGITFSARVRQGNNTVTVTGELTL